MDCYHTGALTFDGFTFDDFYTGVENAIPDVVPFDRFFAVADMPSPFAEFVIFNLDFVWKS